MGCKLHGPGAAGHDLVPYTPSEQRAPLFHLRLTQERSAAWYTPVIEVFMKADCVSSHKSAVQ